MGIIRTFKGESIIKNLNGLAGHDSERSWLAPRRGRMHRTIRLFAIFSTLFLSMCTFYSQEGAIVSPNGLSCQNRTDYGLFQQQQSAQCYYRCPDGTGRQPEIEEEFTTSSPLYNASREELDARFCQGLAQTTLTPMTATVSLPPSETATSSPTPEIALTGQSPLLSGDVTMCDIAVNLINFRMIKPVRGLTVEGLDVQIGDQPTSCSVNPTNPSLLTCNIPASVAFPARVLVRLNGAVVNDFVFDGVGCAKISTAFPTTTP
jgi:hypothetical protein